MNLACNQISVNQKTSKNEKKEIEKKEIMDIQSNLNVKTETFVV